MSQSVLWLGLVGVLMIGEGDPEIDGFVARTAGALGGRSEKIRTQRKVSRACYPGW